ncbi:MAG: hypothetical protein RR482_01950 [Clostridia bacterium]
MKRIPRLLLVLLLVLTLALPVIAQAEKTELPPLEITWIGHSLDDPAAVDGSTVQKAIEERFNVTIHPVTMSNSNNDQWNLYWAAGNMADHISCFSAPQYQSLIEQSLVRPLELAQIQEKMPTWMSKVVELAGDEALVQAQMPWTDGNYYGVPYLHAAVMESGTMLIRKDWLDKLQLAIPTTLDELHTVLTAFTLQDPDGNGANDTYGINGNGRYHFNYVFGAYGIMPKTYAMDAEGKVYYTSTSETYREAIKTLAGWYKEGLIDPETFTDDRTKQREKWAAGKFGVLSDNAFWGDSARGAIGVIEMVKVQNPAADVVAFEAVTGSDGLRGSYLDYPNVMGQGVFAIGADTSDEVMERIFMIKEAFAADYDFYKFGQYGREGEQYTCSEDGHIVVKAGITPEELLQLGSGQFYAIQPQSFAEYGNASTLKDAPLHTIAQTQPSIFNKCTFYTPGENVSNTNLGADVATLVDEYYAQAVMGLVDIDATWEDYVARVNAAGLEKIVGEYQEKLVK